MVEEPGYTFSLLANTELPIEVNVPYTPYAPGNPNTILVKELRDSSIYLSFFLVIRELRAVFRFECTSRIIN